MHRFSPSHQQKMLQARQMFARAAEFRQRARIQELGERVAGDAARSRIAAHRQETGAIEVLDECGCSERSWPRDVRKAYEQWLHRT